MPSAHPVLVDLPGVARGGLATLTSPVPPAFRLSPSTNRQTWNFLKVSQPCGLKKTTSCAASPFEPAAAHVSLWHCPLCQVSGATFPDATIVLSPLGDGE